MPRVQLDELSLFYQERGNPESDRMLLALHPATASGELLGWALPRNHKFHIILPDQRGHGKTPNPAPDFHMPRLVDDMLNLLDMLDIDQIHGLGYSMGAGVLLNIAAQYPEKLLSLTLIGATHHTPTPEQLTDLAGPLEKRSGLALETTHPERGIRVGWLEDIDALSQFKGSVALIGGDREEVHDVEDYARLYRIFLDAQLLVVPGCSHFGFHNNPLVKEFLRQRFDELGN